MSHWNNVFEEDVRPEHRNQVLMMADKGLDLYRARRRRFILGTVGVGVTAAAAVMVKVKIIDGPPTIEAAALQANLMRDYEVVKELDFFEDLGDANEWQSS